MQASLIDVLGRIVQEAAKTGMKRGPHGRAGCPRWPGLARAARRRAPTRRSRTSRSAPPCARDAGEIVTGCNIENASYGLTLCAERVAVFKAVSEGLREFDAIAVVADSPKLAAPCGPCRQILWEFCGRHLGAHGGPAGHDSLTVRMSELLPLPVRSRTWNDSMQRRGA